MVLWLLHSWTKISNIFNKIYYDGQSFQVFTKITVSRLQVFYEKNYSAEFLKVPFYLKKIPVQMFSLEICQIF